MLNPDQMETIYAFVTAYAGNPRISVRELHKKYSYYKNRQSTERLLRLAKKTKILTGPTIWCNSGIDVQIIDNIDDPVLYLEKESINPDITYMIALIGEPSIICFKKGASILEYAEAIIPSSPAKKSIEAISLKKKGKLPPDAYPHGWNELDWQVYNAMRDPSVSFVKAGDSLNVSWHTVKNHYEKIMEDCKTWVTFLPRGYDNYQQSILLFKTEYEVGLREELQNLDRASLLYKCNGKIILHLFLDKTLDNLVFYQLKRKGIIHDLHVSIPIGWYSSV